ncbi:SAM-dependent methyltransferase [Cryobacterium psychrotolerans]|nr:SAM-dependent methyltransferase [Cryobacterium psychrotolerans]
MDILDDIARLTDRLFDDLSVLGQSPEATSRGAEGDSLLEVDLSSIRARLARARDELATGYSTLRAAREKFVAEQLEVVRAATRHAPTRLHIGSGGHRLDGWVNIDAGGDDLALNVNWGLPFPDGSVAFVYAAHLLEHMRFRDQAPVLVAEILRVLEPGGTARFVVPDVGRLLEAYVSKDSGFFAARNRFYPLSEGFVADQVATLDYILLFCGADSQTMNFNHKFGYDNITLRKLLIDAGFREATESAYQRSAYPELRVDDYGYNASTTKGENEHFSLFVEASK